MRTATRLCLAFLLTTTPLVWADDDRAKVLAQQKKAAEEAWKAMDVGEVARAETAHLLIFAAPSLKPRLKSIAPLLERYHDQAARILAVKSEEAYPGKITVYLFDSRDQVPAFARRVEKRRPTSGESASFLAFDDQLHAAAAPGTGKFAPPVEARAGEMIAALLLQRKAKPSTSLPEWFTHGFGRATSYRVLGNSVKWIGEERKLTRLLVRKYAASDVWEGKVEGAELEPLQASVADVLTYGAGTARLQKLLVGFVPGENMDSRTVPQALEAAGLTTDRINQTWKAWVK